MDLEDDIVDPAGSQLEGMRRRKFLGLLAGLSGGLVLGRRAFGKGLLGDPPAADPTDPDPVPPCTLTTCYSTRVTHVTTPSTSYSTVLTVPAGPGVNTTAVQYTTFVVTGATTWPVTVTNATGGTAPGTQSGTTSMTGTVFITVTIRQPNGGTRQTQVGTRPSGVSTGTVTYCWTKWINCTAPPAGNVVVLGAPGHAVDHVTPPKAVGLLHSVSGIPPLGTRFDLGV
jgi:hypothetical protein